MDYLQTADQKNADAGAFNTTHTLIIKQKYRN